MPGADNRKGKTWIGTSGLVLPGPKKTFPIEFQSTSRLYYYSTLFNSVEINSSFYKLHKAATFKRWSGDVLDDFAFTVKLWKEITHQKNLEYKDEDLDAFVKTLNFPREKQGCLLIQFPASIKVATVKKVETLLTTLKLMLKSETWNICIEFRDQSWYEEDTASMLAQFNANPVYHDIEKSAPPLNTGRYKVIYLRFHGPEPGYRGTYTAEFLDEYAQLILGWNEGGKNVYAYFNNTLGKAFDNALYLNESVNARNNVANN